MRFARVKSEGQSFYHCVSRVVEGRFIFQSTGQHGSAEAERFLKLMRRLEKSSKATLPSGSTAAIAVTEFCGPSALRAFLL